MKCKNCKKEIVNPIRKNFCGQECSYNYQRQRDKLKSKIKTISKHYDFDVRNEEKIINAKMLLFSNDNILRCPCLSQDPDHYCGSARCIADTVYLGHCCCQLFWSKKEPLLKNDNEVK